MVDRLTQAETQCLGERNSYSLACSLATKADTCEKKKD